MSEQADRLIRCFASVFPELTPDEIRAATSDSLAAWDSLAAVTLAAVVEQEFGVAIDLLNHPELTSFGAFRQYLAQYRDREFGKEFSESQ